MSAVRTGLLIGGPCDGQAVRVVIGQPDILIPFRPHSLAVGSMTFDPATPDADGAMQAARYRNERIGGLPDTSFEFFIYVGVAR